MLNEIIYSYREPGTSLKCLNDYHRMLPSPEHLSDERFPQLLDKYLSLEELYGLAGQEALIPLLKKVKKSGLSEKELDLIGYEFAMYDGLITSRPGEYLYSVREQILKMNLSGDMRDKLLCRITMLCWMCDKQPSEMPKDYLRSIFATLMVSEDVGDILELRDGQEETLDLSAHVSGQRIEQRTLLNSSEEKYLTFHLNCPELHESRDIILPPLMGLNSFWIDESLVCIRGLLVGNRNIAAMRFFRKQNQIWYIVQGNRKQNYDHPGVLIQDIAIKNATTLYLLAGGQVHNANFLMEKKLYGQHIIGIFSAQGQLVAVNTEGKAILSVRNYDVNDRSVISVVEGEDDVYLLMEDGEILSAFGKEVISRTQFLRLMLNQVEAKKRGDFVLAACTPHFRGMEIGLKPDGDLICLDRGNLQ